MGPPLLPGSRLLAIGEAAGCVGVLVLQLKGGGFALNRIARELALDLGDAAFRPDCVRHAPGVASGIADELSRRAVPGRSVVLPSVLSHVPETAPRVRDAAWWLSVPAASAPR